MCVCEERERSTHYVSVNLYTDKRCTGRLTLWFVCVVQAGDWWMPGTNSAAWSFVQHKELGCSPWIQYGMYVMGASLSNLLQPVARPEARLCGPHKTSPAGDTLVWSIGSTAQRQIIRNNGLPLQSRWLSQLGDAHLAVSHALRFSPAKMAKQVLTDVVKILCSL